MRVRTRSSPSHRKLGADGFVEVGLGAAGPGSGPRLLRRLRALRFWGRGPRSRGRGAVHGRERAFEGDGVLDGGGEGPGLFRTPLAVLEDAVGERQVRQQRHPGLADLEALGLFSKKTRAGSERPKG